jgi:hypothetical protein
MHGGRAGLKSWAFLWAGSHSPCPEGCAHIQGLLGSELLRGHWARASVSHGYCFALQSPAELFCVWCVRPREVGGMGTAPQSCSQEVQWSVVPRSAWAAVS